MSFVEVTNLGKTYISGEVRVDALHGVNFEIEQGEICVIVGASGAGKTTLLNILGGMDEASAGSVVLDGDAVTKYNKKQLVSYRRYDVGFVFQFYNLIQNMTALENVELATGISRNPLDAKQTLISVGLGERLNNFPAQLSGGEQQRVAIARAIAKNPKLLLCDEPTGALDYVTGKQILSLLYDMSKNYNMTVVIITHNQSIAKMADRVIHINSGTVSKVEINENPLSVEEISW